MRKLFAFTLIAVTLLSGCVADNDELNSRGETKLLTLSIIDTRTALGEKQGDTYPVYWSEGDRIAVNGVMSQEAVINSDKSSASFYFDSVISTPYQITYPYCESSTADAPKVVFPAEQEYVAGSFATATAPMCGYATSAAGNIALKHLAGVLQLSVKADKEGVILDHIVITASSTKLAGEFAVNCQNAGITPSDNASNTILYALPSGFTLSTKEATPLNIVVPAGNISSCTFEFVGSADKKMTLTWNPSSMVKAGVVREFKSINFIDGLVGELPNLEEDEDYLTGIPGAQGFVWSSNGQPLEGVVVSDGLLTTVTDKNGHYFLDSNLEDAKFIWVSIPSGYKAPSDANGLPQFYHRISALERGKGEVVADFTFNPIAGDPNRYTILIGADLQPRAKTSTYDRIAFHSLDVAEDFYLDMHETTAAITDREVYGMILGDIVHENMSLFPNYVKGVKSIGLQMFNVIGNHDHDYSAATDVEAARKFEEYFGPSYYSFNIGKQHFVVLDNIIMAVADGKVQKDGYAYGLTDREWQWMSNDLKHVAKTTTIMVASHNPLFKKDSANTEFQNQSEHGSDYANLLKQYSKVHAWAGHTHRSFNYVYSSFNSLKNIEVHTLARSTGELWTNEYNAYGTPRGYTVVDVDGDNISWYFKPTTYQQAKFIGNDYSTVGQPPYTLRQWNYDDNGVGIMKKGGNRLDQAHQMSVWKSGNYIYANIYLWDSKWGTPTFNGSKMSQRSRTDSDALDGAYLECRDFFESSSYLKDVADYLDDYKKADRFNAIFRISNSNATGSGTISVTDRFGNTYNTEFSW